MIRAVLLDVDGTLVDSNDLHAKAWCDVLERHGYPTPFERVRPLIGMGGDKLIPALTGLRPDRPEAQAIAHERKRRFLERYLSRVKPFPSVRPLLERMARDGYALVVASSARRDEMEGLLMRAGVKDLVQRETTADDAESSKPEPDIVEAALHKARVSADEAIMLGDTPYDIEAAARAHVPVIAFTCGGWSADDLRGAVAVYRDPAELVSRYASSPLARAEGQELAHP